MLSRTAKIVVPRLLNLMSGGQVNSSRCKDCNESVNWAIPIKVGGVPNMYKVNAALYRSGQPSSRGFRNLEERGIRSCISFRTHHTDNRVAMGTTLLCKTIPLFGSFITENDIIEALIDIHYRFPKPVLIHCYQGADRTGMFCAAYRMVIENWSKEQAIDEMTKGGFGYHSVYHSLVEILRHLNVDKVRMRLKDFGEHYAKLGIGK